MKGCTEIMDKIYTKDEFVRRMAAKGYTLKDCGQVVDDMLDTIREIMIEGNGVKFRGFGAFEVRNRAARTSISPATKEKIEIPASKGVHFAPGTLLKHEVRDGKKAE